MKYINDRWQLDHKEVFDKKARSEVESLRNDRPANIDLSLYTNYYFDADDGNDKNSGLSVDKPKQSLTAICEIIQKHSGVQILLKRGIVFRGSLVLINYKASESLPLLIDAYGEGDKPPKIVGKEAVVHITGSNVRLSNIEVTGPTAYRGIYITPLTSGVLENVVIFNCYVHDINWQWNYSLDPKDLTPDEININDVCPLYEEDEKTLGRYHYRYYGGIIAHNEYGPSYFKNIWFINNIIKNVARTGLTIYNKWTNKPGVGYGYNDWVNEDFESDFETGLGYFGSKNIYCLNNYVECAAADGIVISSAENVVLRGNTSYYANYLGRTGYWNASIWVYNVKNCLFEYNEAAYTYKRHGSEDAQGFDLDNCCENVLMQYNYAHHNEGGGLLCCNLKTEVILRDNNGGIKVNKNGTPQTDKLVGKWLNNYIYKNYFWNNGNKEDKTRSAFLTIAREVTHSTFINNIVVSDSNISGQSIIHTEDESTYCYNLDFINNIFYSAIPKEQVFTTKMMFDSNFKDNYYHNIKSVDKNTYSINFPHEFNEFTLELSQKNDVSIFSRQKSAQDNLLIFSKYISNGGFTL